MTANGASILTPAKNYSPRTLRLVAVCFLLSGATGLIYEVLWARMLGLVFGVTTLAISAVLAAFMGALALGSALAARFAPRINRPVRVYALIEIVVGVYALAVPLLFRGVDRSMPKFGREPGRICIPDSMDPPYRDSRWRRSCSSFPPP